MTPVIRNITDNRTVEPHPIRLVVEDDLQRSRLTVFFRLILAIPHLIWFILWSIAVFLAAILSWFIVLVTAQLPGGLHRFFAAYVRYATHLYAYLYLAANDYPGFVGEAGDYPVDVKIEGPRRQSRWKTLVRFLIALPAILLTTALSGAPGGGGGGGWQNTGSDGGQDYGWSSFSGQGGVIVAAAFFGWFVCVALARMPLGFRDLAVYGLRYSAQTSGFLLFLTDRYPTADTREPAATQPTPQKPIRLRVEDDLRRSRLTVFFRLLLALPHLVWLLLWGIAVFFALIFGWFATLITGRLPEALHRFVGAYLRYDTHVIAFLFLIANPFPGFTGAPGSYPVDLEIDPREPQNRWKTLFRIFLAIPAFTLSFGLNGVLWLVAVFGWFVGVFLARMPEGLRNLGAYCLRYLQQSYGYLYLLTDSYPFAGPADYVEPEVEGEPEALPAWPGPLRPSSPSS
jgi:ABC-type multidrug transport system fused ATPase/permease subunit